MKSYRSLSFANLFLKTIGSFALAIFILAGPAHATCPTVAQGIYNACTYATGGAGTAGSPWTGWESGVNALPANVEIYFPVGTYQQGATINTKQGWTLRGAGIFNSVITASSSFNGTVFTSSSPINGSTAVYLRIEDLYLVSNNTSSSSNAGIDVVGGTFVYIKRVLFSGFAVGIWLDQAELADVEECVFDTAANGIAGIYLVNGPYHTAGANTGFTNRIGIRKNQFNGTGIANYIGVYDEGGVAHAIRDNNFQGGAHAMRIAAGRGISVQGNEIEVPSAEPIFIGITTPNESWTDSTLNLSIQHNTMSPPSAYSSITFPTPSGGNTVLGATISDNLMGTGAGYPVSIAGINNVANLVAYSNNNFSNNSVPLSAIGPGEFQVLGNMTISTTNALGGTPPTPPANTFYIYVDSADNTLKARGSNGTVTPLALP